MFYSVWGQSWRGTKCGCKIDWLWVRSPLEKMKYLLKFIFLLFRSGVEDNARRWVLPLNTQCLQNSAESRERSVLTLSSLCLLRWRPAVCGIQREADFFLIVYMVVIIVFTITTFRLIYRWKYIFFYIPYSLFYNTYLKERRGILAASDCKLDGCEFDFDSSNQRISYFHFALWWRSGIHHPVPEIQKRGIKHNLHN